MRSAIAHRTRDDGTSQRQDCALSRIPHGTPLLKVQGRVMHSGRKPVSFSLRALAELEKLPQPLGSGEAGADGEIISSHRGFEPKVSSRGQTRKNTELHLSPFCCILHGS